MEVTYVGGSWVWIEFDNRNACTRFKQSDEVKYYFHVIQNLSRQFVVDEKVVWIEIIGMPLGTWSISAFKKIESLWGEVVFIDKVERGGIGTGRICIKLKSDVVVDEEVMIELEGIKHKIKVKEIGYWIPTFALEEVGLRIRCYQTAVCKQGGVEWYPGRSIYFCGDYGSGGYQRELSCEIEGWMSRMCVVRCVGLRMKRSITCSFGVA